MWKSKDVYYLSGNTGILAKDMGKALLCQFPEISFNEELIPFIRSESQARRALDYLVGNAPMAEAAIAEVRRRQREDMLGIVASYVTPGVYSGMMRGRILASVTDFPVLQGRMAIRQGLRALEGKPLEPYLGPSVELVEPATLGRYPMDWMLPPAGFVPAYDVAPTRP